MSFSHSVKFVGTVPADIRATKYADIFTTGTTGQYFHALEKWNEKT